MISFHQNGRRFHLRAGGIVLHQDHVLLHRLEGDQFWAVPGGRVEMGEQAGETLIREFLEELGIGVTTGDLVCVGENFFDYQGEPHHEVGLYLAIELPQGSPLLDLEKTHVGTEGNQRLEFKWFHRGRLGSLDFRPSALRTLLESAGSVKSHFVQRD